MAKIDLNKLPIEGLKRRQRALRKEYADALAEMPNSRQGHHPLSVKQPGDEF
jgi:hypothetical protein